jgi:hypothetical protein
VIIIAQNRKELLLKLRQALRFIVDWNNDRYLRTMIHKGSV